MISRTDEKGICTYVSAASRDVLGYEPEELVGTNLFDLAHPDEGPGARALFARALETGQSSGRPYLSRMRHKNGSYVWVEMTGKILHDADGRVVAVQASGRDVSERVQAQEALAQSEENFRALIDRMPNAVVVHREARLVYANPSFARLLGYESADVLVGRNVMELVQPEHREAIGARIEAPRRVHAFYPEHQLIRADGTRAVVQVTPIPIVFGGALADMALVDDLTEKKAMEAELMVADRMAALGRLSASVGHEINNPLAYVVGSLELMRSELASLGKAAEPVLERLGVVEEGIERVRAIVADLRNFSSVHEGTLGAVDPASAIERAVATASHETRMRARVVRELRSTGHVHAEERRLVQVLVNLLVNAAHAIPEGDVEGNEIRVITRDQEDGLSIEVWDTGLGLPEGDPAKLFEPFFTTKGERAGTGLGLSISHRIITSFGGSIRAERRPDRGSIFRITLPRAEPELAAEASAPRVEPSADAKRLRVLLVDDELALAAVVRALLEPHEVVVEHSGRAAMDRLANDASFDVVLCDLQMPHGSGADIHQHARTTRPGLERRFVFMTGGVFTEQARAFLRDCTQPVLQKPFSSRALHAALAEIVKLG